MLGRVGKLAVVLAVLLVMLAPRADAQCEDGKTWIDQWGQCNKCDGGVAAVDVSGNACRGTWMPPKAPPPAYKPNEVPSVKTCPWGATHLYAGQIKKSVFGKTYECLSDGSIIELKDDVVPDDTGREEVKIVYNPWPEGGGLFACRNTYGSGWKYSASRKMCAKAMKLCTGISNNTWWVGMSESCTEF